MFARESIRPTKIVAQMQEPQELRAGDAYRAVNDAVGSIGFAPFAVPQPTLILLAAVATVLLIRGPLSAIGVVTIVPLALTVAMWSIWQQVYDAYVFLTIVPAALLAILWTTRLLPDSGARSLSAACARSVDCFVHKTIHRHSTVIPSGFSTGFDNPHRRVVRPRAIP